MWYEILPCVAIMGVCLSLPQVISHYGNIWFYGNPMRRDLSQMWDLRMMERDLRLTGDASTVLITRGLENIPDKKP